MSICACHHTDATRPVALVLFTRNKAIEVWVRIFARVCLFGEGSGGKKEERWAIFNQSITPCRHDWNRVSQNNQLLLLDINKPCGGWVSILELGWYWDSVVSAVG